MSGENYEAQDVLLQDADQRNHKTQNFSRQAREGSRIKLQEMPGGN